VGELVMAELTIKAFKRDIIGNNSSYKLKQQGRIPGVLYGPDYETVNVSLDGKKILSIINKPKLRNAIFSVELENEDKPVRVLLKEIQTDPVKNRLLHVDLYAISADKEMTLVVPVKLTGHPIGLDKGGLLEQQMREVEIKCLPDKIPEFIEADVSNLDMGFNLHLSDIEFPEGVVPVTELKRTVAVITEPESEEKLEALEEGLTEGAVAAEPLEEGEEPIEGEETTEETSKESADEDLEK
jgi:large subunit ribosomal protein L25